LVRDQFDAPRTGKNALAGLGVLAMWRAMQVLREFDYREIAASASANDLVVKPATAQSYVQALDRAGYFKTVRESKPGTPARHRLVRDTGAHAPAITRRKCVFDRNTGTFAELQSAEEVAHALA
jgi:hypothetical protein